MKLHHSKKTQKLLGLLIGIVFGFLLHKGGATRFDIIISQLRLRDFTVLKIMLSSVAISMLGISYLYPRRLIKLTVKSGSIRNSVIGGLIFGAGFALLGLCPGTMAGAVGNGYLDALFGGITGIIIGSFLFAVFYERLKKYGILVEDKLSGVSLFDLIEGNPFKYTLPIGGVLIGILILIEVFLG